METIEFNEIIRDPEVIAVVGGLLPIGSFTTKGLSYSFCEAPYITDYDKLPFDNIPKNGMYLFTHTSATLNNPLPLNELGFCKMIFRAGGTNYLIMYVANQSITTIKKRVGTFPQKEPISSIEWGDWTDSSYF